MICFVDTYKDHFGVEAICRVMSKTECGFMTARGYRAAKSRPKSCRQLRDFQLIPVIERLHVENYSVYGRRKMWQTLRRAGWDIGRDQCARLMKTAGLAGVRRGRKPITTHSSKHPDERLDLVDRDFTALAPNRLWVADITYVRTTSGFCYTAFVTDVFSRRIVGWATRSTMRTEDLPLEALEHALITAKDQALQGLVHHSDRGSQYVSIRYSEKLADLKMKASVGSVGDSYDNAMAETVNGLYKAELIHTRTAWPSVTEVEFQTMLWVSWWNNTRIHEGLGYKTPKEYETAYYEQAVSQPAHA